jgi:excisionase family DNA binding protein
VTESDLELLTTKEAAQFLRLSPSAIHKLRKEGELPFVQLGKKVFFKKETLVEYVNDQMRVYE